MKINHGRLEKAEWKGAGANTFYKDGFTIWFYDVWTLEKSPKNASQSPILIKVDIKTMEELFELTQNQQLCKCKERLKINMITSEIARELAESVKARLEKEAEKREKEAESEKNVVAIKEAIIDQLLFEKELKKAEETVTNAVLSGQMETVIYASISMEEYDEYKMKKGNKWAVMKMFKNEGFAILCIANHRESRIDLALSWKRELSMIPYWKRT